MATTPSAPSTALVPERRDEDSAAPRRVVHRDLPVMIADELEKMVGFVQLTRLLGGLLVVLGGVAVAAGVTLGLPVLAAVAVLMSTLILYALWEDTRLANALDLLRRRRIDEAESALAKIATSPRRSPWQRQRARTYLASLAWRRGDVEQALTWMQARLAVPRRGREEPTERWLAHATEVQLLALSGNGPQARAQLGELPPPPPEEHALLVAAQTELLVAFVLDDFDSVRERLDGWEPMVRARDGVGLGLALLAWANAGRGDRDRALRLVREVRACDDGHLARYYPRLWQWIERYDDGFHYGRS